ncbi:LuxR C-terminal-related transcriptional regulator [Streptomyces sp. NPDC127164]
MRRLGQGRHRSTGHTQIWHRSSDLGSTPLKVLGPIARGLSNTEIAEHLRLSLATVKTHIGLVPGPW